MSLPLLRPLSYQEHPLVSRPSAGVLPGPSPLVDDFGALASSTFEPNDVHPAIHRFYAQPEGIKVTMRWLRWETWALPLSLPYVPAARRLGNLCVPDRIDEPMRMAHEVRRTEDGGRLWTRRFGATGAAFYSATFRSWVDPDGDATYFSMVFPLPQRTAVLVALRLRNKGDAMVASSRSGARSGSWLLRTAGRRFVPLCVLPTDEELTFRVEGGRIYTVHEDFIRDRRTFALEYGIDLMA